MSNRNSFIGWARLLYKPAGSSTVTTIEGLKCMFSPNITKAKAMGSSGAMNLPRRIEKTSAEPQFKLLTNEYNDLIQQFIGQIDGAQLMAASTKTTDSLIQIYDNEDAVGSPSIIYDEIKGDVSVDGESEYGRDNFTETTIVIDLELPMPGCITENLSSDQPTISGISPTSGAEGAAVVITGTNFRDVAAVTIGLAKTPMAFIVDSATQITAYIPEGASTGAIRVVTYRGAVDSGTFTVTA